MREIFRKLQEAMKAGNDCILVTIIASTGSVPRGSGARMLVTKDGRVAGTIGGGAVEYESIRLAGELLASKKNFVKHYRLDTNDTEDIGMICGGDVDVYFRLLRAEDEKLRALTDKVMELFKTRGSAWLVTQIAEEDGIFTVFTEEGPVSTEEFPEEVMLEKDRPALIECKDGQFYVERLLHAGKVYIFGGGHVAQQLVPVLDKCDFSCIVVEDRPDFADPGLFQGLAQTRCIPCDQLHTLIPEITEEDYVCIMTRGHSHDYEALYEMLKTPARYIGLIGSRKKIAAGRERLKKDGYTDREINRITAPIGLEIGSETPEEIAVSIAAQLIGIRSGKITG